MKELTKELVTEAINTAHSANCHTATNHTCIHAKPMSECAELIMEAMAKSLAASDANDLSPATGLLLEGIHIGYRMHQLQVEAEPESQIRTETTTVN